MRPYSEVPFRYLISATLQSSAPLNKQLDYSISYVWSRVYSADLHLSIQIHQLLYSSVSEATGVFIAFAQTEYCMQVG